MAVHIEPSHKRTPRSPLTDVTRFQEGLSLRVLAGEWPDDIEGHAFFTSPDIAKGTPLFGADGMLYRFDLSGRGAVVRSATLRTPAGELATALESRELKSSWAHRFRTIGISRISPLLGVAECCNVQPLPVGNQLWVTSDAGRPWVVDPTSLDLLGPVGSRHDWKGATPMPWTFPLYLTSGHPVVDRDGLTVYGANFSNLDSPGTEPFFRLVRMRKGEVRPFNVVDRVSGKAARIHQSVHQMAQSEHHLIVLDSAFHVEAQQLLVEAMRTVVPLPPAWFAGASMEAQRDVCVFWIIRKADLTDEVEAVPARRIEISREATHFAADWEETDGVLRLVVLHTPCQDVSEWVRQGEVMAHGRKASPDLVGLPAGVPMEHGDIGVHRVFPDGRVESVRHQHDPFTWGPALFTTVHGAVPRVDHLWYYTAGFAADALPQRLIDTYKARLGLDGTSKIPLEEGRPSSVIRLDTRTGTFDGWSAPDGWGIFGLCFVPRTASDDPWDGWLLAAALSDVHEGLPDGSKGDELWLFDAQNVAQGPIARMGAEGFNLPFLLHSSWVPRLVRPSIRTWSNPHDDLEAGEALAAWMKSTPMPWLARTAIGAWFRASLDHVGLSKVIGEAVTPRFRDA